MRKNKFKNNYKDMSWIIFHDKFRTENDCYNWLFNDRWPNGFSCPRCGSKSIINYDVTFDCPNCILEFEKSDFEYFDDDEILSIDEKRRFSRNLKR